MREEASVLEMLEKVSNITYFRNVYLDMDSTLYNPYNYDKYEVPTFPTASMRNVLRPWRDRRPSR